MQAYLREKAKEIQALLPAAGLFGRKHRKWILAGLAAAALLVAVVGLCRHVLLGKGTGAGSEPSVSVRFPIPIIESGQTPFYVAHDLGFYGREDLNVNFEMGSRELNPVKMVATGQDMFGVLGGPDTLLVARSKGQPLKAVAVLHRDSNFPCLVTLRKSGITDVRQLQGKKIGFNYGHISTDVIRNLLRKFQIRCTEVDVGFDYNQFITGQVDAQWAFTVTAGMDLAAKGIELNFINPADYGIVTHGYTIFALEKTIEERPELVTRFLRATLRGVDYTVENPEEANRALLRRDPRLDEALNLRRLKAYNRVTSAGERYPAGYMDRAMFQTTYDRLVEEKVIDKPFDVGEAYTTRFLATIYGRSFDR